MKRNVEKFKKVSSLVVTLAVILNTFVMSGYAYNKVDIMDLATESNISSMTPYARKLELMDDGVLDQAVTAMIMQTDNIEELRDRLKECDIELLPVEKMTVDVSQNLVSDAEVQRASYNLSDDEVELLVHALKRGGQDYYHLCCGFTFNGTEADPATMDAVAMYYDATKADYYDYYDDSYGFSLRSGQQIYNGTIVFNFKDSYLNQFTGDPDYPYTCAVYVTPKAGAQNIAYGVDYYHTYGETELDLTDVSVDVTFGGTGLASGSVGTNFSVSHNEYTWQIAGLNVLLAT